MDMSKNPLEHCVLISASLPPGQKSLTEVATRFATLVDLLSQTDPLLRAWYNPTSPTTRVRLTQDVSRLEQLIYTQSIAEGATSPRNAFGYWLGASNKDDSDGWSPHGMLITMKAGGDDANRIWVQTDPFMVPDPRLTRFGLIKQILLALAEAFDPIFGQAHHGTLYAKNARPRDRNPILGGWMLLLPATLARQVTPPTAAISDILADGSLFMAATDETYDIGNPKHLAGAKAIEDAIAPINKWSLVTTDPMIQT